MWSAATSIVPVLDAKVFKAYDIRGIYPEDLDEAGAYAIGRAYVEEFEPRTIAVGRDMRLSSPSMADAVMRGATEAGADVIDLGLVGTEMVYYAVGELDLEGGVMVTASHNPKEYTGMKIVRRGALPVGGDSGLPEIRTRAMSVADRPRGQSLGNQYAGTCSSSSAQTSASGESCSEFARGSNRAIAPSSLRCHRATT